MSSSIFSVAFLLVEASALVLLASAPAFAEYPQAQNNHDILNDPSEILDDRIKVAPQA